MNNILPDQHFCQLMIMEDGEIHENVVRPSFSLIRMANLIIQRTEDGQFYVLKNRLGEQGMIIGIMDVNKLIGEHFDALVKKSA